MDHWTENYCEEGNNMFFDKIYSLFSLFEKVHVIRI